MKCDEGQPACMKCISTGRVCEGYGVWGGGNTLDLVRPASINQSLLRHVAPESQGEHGFMEWFRFRTAVKLQGPFGSQFWDTLVTRASLEESSVFHAMLALSSHHKRVYTGMAGAGPEEDPNGLELFTLRQYNKAINDLQPHFSSRDKASLRVALVTCMVFICLEFLRGRYKTGNIHLQNGIKLLAGLQGNLEQAVGPRNILTRASINREPTDDWIIEAFTRMNLLAVQFGQGYWMSPNLHFSNHLSLPITFESVAQARHCLDNMFNDIHHLGKRCRHESTLGGSIDYVPGQYLLDVQQRLRSHLTAWIKTYKSSRIGLQIQPDDISKVGYQLLFLYHIMANILVDTSLRPYDEMAFDSHYHDFVSIITQSIKFLKEVQEFQSVENSKFKSGSELYFFNADIGWIPPLYYTALHCRVHHLRLRAIELLRTIPSREGIWDSVFAASVAQEVMRMEEEGHCNDAQDINFLLPSDQLQDYDMNLPVLSSSRRFYDVQVDLPDSPLRKAVLTCKRKKDDGCYEVITRDCVLDP